MDRSSPRSIDVGPRPGWLGEMVALHGRYYATTWDFPLSFEAKVAAEAAALLARYDPSRDLILTIGLPERLIATLTLDGSDPALRSGETHLRWFIVDDAARGTGLGRRLIAAAIAFARSSGARRIYLTTFRELEAAGALYRQAGFAITSETAGSTWGRTVTEQRLDLVL
jgi:GNAT superfamily N-acetyltransferase